ncbi:unnamed protein product [Fusarium graminearum]|nr:unnamed protein product [Fusarium graminearum]
MSVVRGLATSALRLGLSLTVVWKLEVWVAITSRLGYLVNTGILRSVPVSIPMANILCSHCLGRLHFLRGCEILKRPLAVALGLGQVIEMLAFLRAVLRISTVGEVKMRVLLGVGFDITLLRVLLKLYRLALDVLLTIKNARRLEVLALTALRWRHGSTTSAW